VACGALHVKTLIFGGKIYMDKKTFTQYMQQIQNFHSQQETVSDIIEKISDGWCIITIGNQLVEIIINLINKTLHIQDTELLSWWLYEDVDKIIYENDDETEVSVRTLDELYEYIIKSYN
jgi:hypothetical protein